MIRLVVEAGLLSRLTDAPSPALVAVARARGRRGWRPIDGDDVVAALRSAGAGAVVATRSAEADPGAALLRRLAAAAGHEVVTLPDDADAAAWAVAVAAAGRDGPVARRLQALAGLAIAPSRAIPRRDRGTAGLLPALRPAVLARWAECAWRPCPRCGGGGLPGAPCGRCAAPLPAAAA